MVEVASSRFAAWQTSAQDLLNRSYRATHPALAELGGDAIVGDGGWRGHLLSPAAQLTTTVTGVAAVRSGWTGMRNRPDRRRDRVAMLLLYGRDEIRRYRQVVHGASGK